MIPLGWGIAGGLAVAALGTATGYLAGKDHQRAVDRMEMQADAAARAATSLRDERLLNSLATTIGQTTATALTGADRAAQPIIMGMHDDLRSTPLAVDVRCAVPDGVRDRAAALRGAAERAADAADAASELAGRRAEPAAAR